MSVDFKTIGRAIEHQTKTRPSQAAIILSGRAPLTYRELHTINENVRRELRYAGLGPRARVAIALPDSPDAALATIAIASSCVAVPVNPRHSDAEIEKWLNVLQHDAVLLPHGHKSAARQIAERQALTIIERVPDKHGALSLALVVPSPGKSTAHDEVQDPDQPAFIIQTSGTTGEPRSIPFSHRNMLSAAARLQAWFELTPEDRCLSVSPPYYSHGLKVTVFTPLLTGGTVVFPRDTTKFDYEEWFGTLRPTWYSAGPTLHRLVLEQSKSRPDTKMPLALRFILSGGAPLPADVHLGLQDKLGVPVVEHYGSSEAAQIAANLPSPGRAKLGTCGIPWPDTLKIVDGRGHPLPSREVGEILVRGPTVMSGYLDAPELNDESFVDGWLRTGDIGSLDDEGFLTLHGRQKDLINRGGEKIWPAEVDTALMSHPAVAEAAAFAISHPRLGEDVAAAVVLQPGATATPAEIREFLGPHLASFKIPRWIATVDQLPKGPTGKILRRELSETLAARPMPATAASSFPNIARDDGLISQLIEVWQRLLNVAPVGIDDDFFEKGGDSLLAVQLLIEIERLTGRNVPTSLLIEATTIRKLAAKLSEAEPLKPASLSLIFANGDQAPLIHFHGDPSGGSYVNKLGALLGSDQPIFVIAPHGLDGEPVPRSIEAMAADRLPLILSAQPQGPYRLSGYCVGGLVAFEVARKLVTAGKKVELVAMIDPPTLNARRSVQVILSTLRRLLPRGTPAFDRISALTWYNMAKIEQLTSLAGPELLARAKMKAGKAVKREQRTRPANEPFAADSRGDAVPLPESFHRLPFSAFFWRYSIALASYLPKPLAVRVIYFSAEYRGEAWRRLSSDLEVIKLPGDHYAVPSDPTHLANNLSGILGTKRHERASEHSAPRLAQ